MIIFLFSYYLNLFCRYQFQHAVVQFRNLAQTSMTTMQSGKTWRSRAWQKCFKKPANHQIPYPHRPFCAPMVNGAGWLLLMNFRLYMSYIACALLVTACVRAPYDKRTHTKLIMCSWNLDMLPALWWAIGMASVIAWHPVTHYLILPVRSEEREVTVPLNK